MLKRKAYQKLVDWKNYHKNNCLMFKGARQIGKTYLIFVKSVIFWLCFFNVKN